MNNFNQEQEPNDPIPPGIDVVENEDEIIIRYSWSKVTEYIMPPYLIKNKENRVIEWPRQPGYMMLPFSVIWNSLLISWFLKELISPTIPQSSFLFSIPLVLFFLIIGLFLFYYGICSIVNTTTLRGTKNCISLIFSPLKWLGEKQLYSDHINQFIVKERIQFNSQNVQEKTSENRYELTAIFSNDYQEELLTFSSPEYAHFIKRKLDNFFES